MSEPAAGVMRMSAGDDDQADQQQNYLIQVWRRQTIRCSKRHDRNFCSRHVVVQMYAMGRRDRKCGSRLAVWKAELILASSFCLQDCKIVMLTTYVANLIPKLVVDTTSLMPWFYLSGWRSSSPRMQRKTGYTPLQWLFCKACMATKLARS